MNTLTNPVGVLTNPINILTNPNNILTIAINILTHPINIIIIPNNRGDEARKPAGRHQEGSLCQIVRTTPATGPERASGSEKRSHSPHIATHIAGTHSLHIGVVFSGNVGPHAGAVLAPSACLYSKQFKR